MSRDMRLTQFADSIRRIVQPEEFAANLRRVPWPPPPVAAVGD